MLTEVKKHLTPKQIWADAEFFFLLNLGLVATAAGIALFKTPNHFAFGGTSGLSIVLATLFPRFNVGAFMWVVNAVLVVTRNLLQQRSVLIQLKNSKRRSLIRRKHTMFM